MFPFISTISSPLRITRPDVGITIVQWGQSGDLPFAANFFNEGLDNIVVFRPSIGVWYILQSSTGAVRSTQFGVSGDKPVPAAFVP